MLLNKSDRNIIRKRLNEIHRRQNQIEDKRKDYLKN